MQGLATKKVLKFQASYQTNSLRFAMSDLEVEVDPGDEHVRLEAHLVAGGGGQCDGDAHHAHQVGGGGSRRVEALGSQRAHHQHHLERLCWVRTMLIRTPASIALRKI